MTARNLPPVIALSGLAGSGKSTVAAYLQEKHGYIPMRFAGPLKDMLHAIGLSDDEIEGELKEKPCAVLEGNTPRYAMQTLGTEWGRDTLGRNLWVSLWKRRVDWVRSLGGRVVAEDCRFDNEAAAVRAYGGQVWKVTGRGGIAGNHASEAGVQADAKLANAGSIERLRDGVEAIIGELR